MIEGRNTGHMYQLCIERKEKGHSRVEYFFNPSCVGEPV